MDMILRYHQIRDKVLYHCCKFIGITQGDIFKHLEEQIALDSSFEEDVSRIQTKFKSHMMRICSPREEQSISILTRQASLRGWQIYKEGCMMIYMDQFCGLVREKMKELDENNKRWVETIYAADHLSIEEGIEIDQLNLSLVHNGLDEDDDEFKQLNDRLEKRLDELQRPAHQARE